MKTYHEMVAEEGWSNKDRISVSAVQNLTFKASCKRLCTGFSLVKLNVTIAQLALLIIGKCGFGFSFTWCDPARTSDGHMSVQEALRIVADTFMISTFVPKWIQRLPVQRYI